MKTKVKNVKLLFVTLLQMNKRFLLLYEMPRIAKYISNPLLQTMISKYLAWTINRKMDRYEEYIALEKMVEAIQKARCIK
jgi:hypothetical protein